MAQRKKNVMRNISSKRGKTENSKSIKLGDKTSCKVCSTRVNNIASGGRKKKLGRAEKK